METMFLGSFSLPMESSLQMWQRIWTVWGNGAETALTGMIFEYHNILHWVNFHAIMHVFWHITNNILSGKISIVADSIRVAL